MLSKTADFIAQIRNRQPNSEFNIEKHLKNGLESTIEEIRGSNQPQKLNQ